jgi:hypothetical protein
LKGDSINRLGNIALGLLTVGLVGVSHTTV